MNLPTIVTTAVGIVIAAIILSTTTWDVEEVETYFTYEPYTYEQALVREDQVRKFPWFSEVTRVQYIVKNTDVKVGEFDLNFIFDNGTDIETRTETVAIRAGEEKAVTVDSPLKGVSKVSLNVIPPKKSIPQERIITKKVNGWDYIGRFVIRFR